MNKSKEKKTEWEKMEIWFSQNFHDPNHRNWQDVWTPTKLHFENFLQQEREKAYQEGTEDITMHDKWHKAGWDDAIRECVEIIGKAIKDIVEKEDYQKLWDINQKLQSLLEKK